MYALFAAATTDERYIGCWAASHPAAMLGNTITVVTGDLDMSVDNCTAECKARNYPYAGLMVCSFFHFSNDSVFNHSGPIAH